MSVLMEYFTAPDRATAAAIVSEGPRDPDIPSVDSAIEPVVALSFLAAELTGLSYDDILAAGREGRLVAGGDDPEEPVVVAIPAVAVDALATADEDRRREAVSRWSASEEVRDLGVDLLQELVADLAGLARRGRAVGDELFCWVCL